MEILKGVSIDGITTIDASENAIPGQYIGVGVRQSVHR